MQKIEFKVSVSQFGGRPTIRHLISLKPYWKVAISAMVMRMAQLSVISEDSKRSFFIQMSNLKMRLDEPQPFAKERPAMYAKIVRAAIGEIIDTDMVATKIMRLPPDVFKRLYASSLKVEISSPRLRLA